MSSQIQTFYVRYLYQNVSHIKRSFFNEKSQVSEVAP